MADYSIQLSITKTNMYVDNNDYDTLKSVCEQMLKYYNIHDFQ